MFDKILIANRGEIALRVIRACKELGVSTVAVHSEADRESLHVRMADEHVCIGPAASTQSYLNKERIIAAAEITDASAVHPGYGFMAESAEFAEACRASHLVFIGPEPETIESMGNKVKARERMVDAGVPVVPGSDGPVETGPSALAVASEIGYPVIVKAAAGGGGRGMRVARSDAELETGIAMARAEAATAFGSDVVYIERFVERPRHVEIQILGDRLGSVIHLGERDCSIQRRHQKLLEEAPSPAVDDALRAKMGDAAVRGAEAIGYDSAGTVEFLLTPGGEFYFMEMNTRIQVEHPVTECVTGIDLVKEQIRVAAGDRLGFEQADVSVQGHAIECRINAESPRHNFRPAPGRIDLVYFPGGPGIRVDSHIYPGYDVSPHYDSMIAKLVAHGSTRDEAIRRMRRALEELIIEGIPTTAPFHQAVLASAEFSEGRVDTGFIERFEW
ncbi:MAG: acetyl-CoA carboxylase biotin carboxylase subunit [Gemmatimonadetes bacterium]|nr:acetyl-CoA carboxylase biotin carboxylase subunit [Gemmatimonadota bacterium]